MIRRLLPVAAFLVLLVGCDSVDLTPDAPVEPVFDAEALSNTSYNAVLYDSDDSVILLGQLDFRSRSATDLSGTWHLDPWGEQPLLSDFGTEGSFTGFIYGDRAFLNLSGSSTDRKLGFAVEGRIEDELVGSVALLPSLEIEGRFKALPVE